MRLCHSALLTGLALASLSAASPALADQHPAATVVADAEGRVFNDALPVDTRPVWKGDARSALPAQPVADREAYDRARADWLTECRRRMSYDNGLGSAAIGGLAGGLLGNRIAGRGHRTVGTIAGAAVGAVAGMAIDKGEDKNRARDYCESYLEQYSGGYGQSHYQHGYYAQPMMMMQPVMMVPVAMQQQKPCTETVVTEEWVTVPSRRRVIHYTPRRAPDKRVRIVPDKRVRMN